MPHNHGQPTAMKLLQVSLLSLISSVKVCNASFKPYQISYDDLVAGHVSSGLAMALAKTGMVAVSDMELDSRLLQSQHPCLLQEARQVIKAKDGTIRYTLATQTTLSGGMNALEFENKKNNNQNPTDSLPVVCQEFNESSLSLRVNVQAAVQAFASVLDFSLGYPQEDNVSHGHTSFAYMVDQGTHLEHFHSYVKTEVQEEDEDEPTLDWHVDQGVFLAFMPGRYESGKITQGFFIQNEQGEAEEVDFGGASLVFMLGDGVNRYVSNNKPGLRPVHHALRVPTSGEARVWFGLMVLPPAWALTSEGDQTFGEIRQSLIRMEPDAFALGCSQGVATAVSGFRLLSSDVGSDNDHNTTAVSGIKNIANSSLEATKCPADEEIYCWHQCIHLDEYNLTHQMCKSRSLQVSCLNPRGQVSDGDSHGDFFLDCASADTPAETPFPTLEDYPRDEEACDAFDDFVNSVPYGYRMKLEDGEGAVLQWNVVGEGDEQMIEGRLAFNGVFGYLSIGKSGEGGRNKMFNAPVIFALRGSNYTPETGFELGSDPYIGEYSKFEVSNRCRSDRLLLCFRSDVK
jgi:hypothetical protein